jgi:acetyl esterase/lipase
LTGWATGERIGRRVEAGELVSRPDEFCPVKLPSREIPPPATISAQAREFLSVSALRPRVDFPRPADEMGWHRTRSQLDAELMPRAQMLLRSSAASVGRVRLEGFEVYVARPAAPTLEAAYLFMHGGAFVCGGGLWAKALAALNSGRLGCTVFSVDYRMPPEYPFPAAPDDCLSAYEALLQEYPPGQIVIGGVSAGGNLAAVTALRIRDAGLPAPAGIVLLTPEVDLTESGDTFRTNELIDVVLKRGVAECNAVYANGRDLSDPYLSPLLGDLTRFPPTLVQAGTRDLFLSNAVLFHRKLRRSAIDADLHIWEAMPHGGFGGDAPEDAEVHQEIRAFIAKVTKSGGSRGQP